LWIFVILCGRLIDVLLTLDSGSRYTLGWYVARADILIASSAFLVILMAQINQLYGSLRQANTRLTRDVFLDGLTGVANRRYLDEHVLTAVSHAARHDLTVGFIMVDIDHFKKYNDAFGHLEGDECLRRIALAIAKQVSRQSDFVARFGGEEFAVMLVGTDAAGSWLVAERIRSTVEHLGIRAAPDAGFPVVTVSLGVCVRPARGATAQALIVSADRALYAAKAAGRNRAILSESLAAEVALSGEDSPG
jgi:diguanylate cyclase (GGDEF)-like protein